MPKKSDHIEEIIKHARDIYDHREALHDITVDTEYRMYFRPTADGVTAVSLMPKSAHRGETFQSVEKLLNYPRKELYAKVLSKKKQGKAAKKDFGEDRIHAFLVRDALLHGGFMDCLSKAPSEEGRPFESVRYVMSESASPRDATMQNEGEKKPTCDILALRRCEGFDIPVLLELKAGKKGRRKLQAEGQIMKFTQYLWGCQNSYESLFSVMLHEDVSFAQPVQVERWIVWPPLKNRNGELYRDQPKMNPRSPDGHIVAIDVGIVQFHEVEQGKEKYKFHIGKPPQPVTQP